MGVVKAICGILCALFIFRTPLACEPYIDDDLRWHTARLRTHINEFKQCAVSEFRYRILIRNWLIQREIGLPPVTSVGLGRIKDYPWISTHLMHAARADIGWNTKTGKPVSGGINMYVVNLLGDAGFIKRLQMPFVDSVYRVTGVSIEKVLVHSEHQLGVDTVPVKLPYDAQIWLVMKTDSQ